MRNVKNDKTEVTTLTNSNNVVLKPDALYDCAATFYGASGIGCTVNSIDGMPLWEFGGGTESCGLCKSVGRQRTDCAAAHRYGMAEAERFGGRYIYFCPMGLNFFVSPILGELGSYARITAGPFMMVEVEDYLQCELEDYPLSAQKKASDFLSSLPKVPADRVEHLSKLLYMASGYMESLSALDRIENARISEKLQRNIGDFLQTLSLEETAAYPIETERELLHSIERGDREDSQRLLNNLLGHIMFASGSDYNQIMARLYSLIVLIGRSATVAGADPELALSFGDEGLSVVNGTNDPQKLCLWLSKAMNGLLDATFSKRNAPHARIIEICVKYIEHNYMNKITLDVLAKNVYLSVPYLSRIFKNEMGTGFADYLNTVRVEKSKKLLTRGNLRIADVAATVGFDDQSYYTKVFKKICGVTPLVYRDTNLRYLG